MQSFHLCSTVVTPYQDVLKGSDVPFVLDGVFIITFQVPVILSVFSNSYDEERGYNKTWIQNSLLRVYHSDLCWEALAVHLFHPDLRDGVQHLLVKASSRIITAYLVTVLPPAASMHKSRVSHGYSNAKNFMSETQIIITVPKTQHKVLSKVSTMECW